MMLEVIPPHRRADAKAVEDAAERIGGAVDRLKTVDIINVPEVIEENFSGAPLYKNIDNTTFAVILSKKTGVETAVNKVTPHFPSAAAFESWLQKCVKQHKMRSFVFVGGGSDVKKYSGPTVVDADRMGSKIRGLRIGNICIPSRPEEAERLVAKTQAGASFFTTQLVFEPKSVEKVLERYALKCSEVSVKPANFFISFAPVVSVYDIDFFKWLGAEMPQETEAGLRKSEDSVADSIAIAVDLFSEIREFTERKGISVNLSPNVEAISNANLDSACKMVSAIKEGF